MNQERQENRENYVAVFTKSGRPLAPCHPRRARSMVRQGKASYRHSYGVRCIVLHKTDIPKVKNASRVDIRIDPGRDHTGVAVTRDHPDGSRSALLCIQLDHKGRTVRPSMGPRLSGETASRAPTQ